MNFNVDNYFSSKNNLNKSNFQKHFGINAYAAVSWGAASLVSIQSVQCFSQYSANVNDLSLAHVNADPHSSPPPVLY